MVALIFGIISMLFSLVLGIVIGFCILWWGMGMAFDIYPIIDGVVLMVEKKKSKPSYKDKANEVKKLFS